MSSPILRLLLACAGVSAWLTLLLSGYALGGGTHLLLLAALGVFPWRGVRAPL